VRPLELSLEGFKSYREPCVFDFEGRGLFGIVGPTGAGKTSILDAIIFGLFGKAPRLERDTKKLINSACEQSRVQLAFEADGQKWCITRVLNRKGPSQVVLEAVTTKAEQVVGDRNANERVIEILGLDFDAFCTAVCLPQGQFDRFLRATPSERVQILKGVFRLEKVDELREAARGRHRLIESELMGLTKALELLPEETETRLSEANLALAQAVARNDQIKAAAADVRAAEHSLELSTAEILRLEAQKSQTLKIVADIPPEAELQRFTDREALTQKSCREATAAADAAADNLEKARAAHAELDNDGKAAEWCLTLQSLLDEKGRVSKRVREQGAVLKTLESEVVEKSADAGKQTKVLDRAQATLKACRQAVEALHSQHAAHAIRQTLAAGDVCPVCEQAVSVVPAQAEPPGIRTAKAALAGSEQEAIKSRDRLEDAKRAFALSEDRLDAARRAVKESEGALSALSARVLTLSGADKDPRSELERVREALSHARLAADEAFEKSAVAARAQAAASLQLEQLAGQRQSWRDVIVRLFGLLHMPPASIDEEGMAGAAQRAADAANLTIKELDSQMSKLRVAAVASQQIVSQFRDRFGGSEVSEPVSGAAGGTTSDIVTAAATAVLSQKAAIEHLESSIAQKAHLDQEIKRLDTQKALYQRLLSDMTDSKFTAYLLEGQTRLLCALASEKLFELTSRYVFDETGEGRASFLVVDQITGVKRTPDTLSGGETFLASLSLALALAEAVGRQGGRLGCFFLDEGFGSLDSEALDLALQGIESLAEPGRLIGLISHVGGIQARLDDLIVLDKTTEGATSVVQFEGPLAYAPSAI